MKKKKLMLAWVMIVLLAAGASGCTSEQINGTLGLAVSAGAAYGISRAFK